MAQEFGTIKGKVTLKSGISLEAVSVGLLGTTYRASKKADGQFVIEKVKAGEYIIVSSFLGYETERREVYVKPGETVQMSLIMKESSTQLQEVEITGRKEISYQNDISFVASKTATPLKEVPQAASYVTKEIIQDQKTFRTSEIVKNVSGVNQFSGYDDFI